MSVAYGAHDVRQTWIVISAVSNSTLLCQVTPAKDNAEAKSRSVSVILLQGHHSVLLLHTLNRLQDANHALLHDSSKF